MSSCKQAWGWLLAGLLGRSIASEIFFQQLFCTFHSYLWGSRGRSGLWSLRCIGSACRFDLIAIRSVSAFLSDRRLLPRAGFHLFPMAAFSLTCLAFGLQLVHPPCIEHHCEKHIDWLNNINDDDGLSPYLTENVLTLQIVAAHKHVNYRCCHKDTNYHTNYVFVKSCGGLWVVFLVEIVQ